MVTAATASSAPPLHQSTPFQPVKAQGTSSMPAIPSPHRVQNQNQNQSQNQPPQPQQHQILTADALFEDQAHPSNVNQGSIPFFASQVDGPNLVPSNDADNPLMVHVHQLPTPRTSFSSGAASPPENLSPGDQACQHSTQHSQFSHLTPTSLASLSAASSSAPSPSSTPTSTLQSTIASSSSHLQGYINGHHSSTAMAKSPLTNGYLNHTQQYPTFRSTTPSNQTSTLGPALYGPSSSSTLQGSSTGPNVSYHNGSTMSSIGGAVPNTIGSRIPLQAQQYHGHQQHLMMQEQMDYDDEKEHQKKNARSTISGVTGFLPPALNQGLSKMVHSAQEAMGANGKQSLPSIRPQTDGGFSAYSSSTTSGSTHGIVLKMYKASKLPILCLLWYLSSAVTNNIGKQIMNQFRYPVTLTFVQFVFVSLFCFILGSGFRMTTIRKPTMAIIQMTAPLVGFQVVGHVFSSVAISRVPLSVVHTIKALSPLFTVVFYRIILGTTYSREVYISLIPLTAGVMLACRLSLEFNNLVGLVCALASTLVFVTQNVFTKRILFSNKGKQEKLGGLGNKEATKEDALDEAGSDEKLDKLNILFYSSTMAAMCMIPIWLYAEGVGLLFPEEAGVYHHATHASSFWGTSWLLFLNGISHFFQNIFAFSVLALTSPVTYSIASLIKRIVVIVASIIYFHQTLGTTQWTGVCLTFWGLWLYNSAKNAAKVRPNGGILASTTVGRRVSRNFGQGLLGADSSFSRKGGFLA